MLHRENFIELEDGDWTQLLSGPHHVGIFRSCLQATPAVSFPPGHVPMADKFDEIQVWVDRTWKEKNLPGNPPSVAEVAASQTAAEVALEKSHEEKMAAYNQSKVVGWAFSGGLPHLQEFRLVDGEWIRPSFSCFEAIAEVYRELPDIIHVGSMNKSAHPLTGEPLIVMGKPTHERKPDGCIRAAWAWRKAPKKGMWYGEPLYPQR